MVTFTKTNSYLSTLNPSSAASDVYKRQGWNTATFEDQLGFVVHELNNADAYNGALNVKANTNLKAAKTVDQAATIFDQQYERSSGQHTDKRIREAYRVLQLNEGTAI